MSGADQWEVELATLIDIKVFSETVDPALPGIQSRRAQREGGIGRDVQRPAVAGSPRCGLAGSAYTGKGSSIMLFTATTPARQGDRILLYLDQNEARCEARDGQPIFEVAVGLDASGRRLTSLGVPDTWNDPNWATPAYFEDSGRIMARGPIPGELFAPMDGESLCEPSCI